MLEFPDLASVEIAVSVPSLPWDDPALFVLEFTGRVLAMVNEHETADAGTIKLLRIQAGEAINSRVSLADVCDAHSDFLAAMYLALFDREGDPERS